MLTIYIPGATLISYWVLATDYVRYAVVYSCSPNPVTPANFIGEYHYHGLFASCICEYRAHILDSSPVL